MVMRILLIRHGQPHIALRPRTSHGGFADYIDAYEQAGLSPSDLPPKELRDLETNDLIKRTVYDSVPVVVEYSMTEYGKTLGKLIDELQAWGMKHRRRILKKEIVTK